MDQDLNQNVDCFRIVKYITFEIEITDELFSPNASLIEDVFPLRKFKVTVSNEDQLQN